jgi:GR25 family glycosyltransferase involved in LPS biosynthesis
MKFKAFPNRKFLILLLLIFQIITIFIFFRSNVFGSTLKDKQTPFSKVFLINRKSRIDRLMTMIEIMKLVQIDYEVVDAIDIESYEVQQAAATNKLRAGETACYASHLLILRKALIENLSSILVLEDDIDMDLSVTAQLFEIVNGLEQGKDILLDLIFFGHCLEARGTFVLKTLNYEILKSVHPSCTHAYGITQGGIRKLLHAYENDVNSIKSLKLPIDYLFQKAMNEKVLNGYSVFPQVIIQHRTGNGIKSDLRPDEELVQPTIRRSALAKVKVIKNGY